MESVKSIKLVCNKANICVEIDGKRLYSFATYLWQICNGIAQKKGEYSNKKILITNEKTYFYWCNAPIEITNFRLNGAILASLLSGTDCVINLGA